MSNRFLHKPLPGLLQYESMESFTDDTTGKRAYYPTKNGEKVAYPSVTTVLSANPEKKKSLAKWRAKVGNETANKISSAASGRGTILHKIFEDYLNNEPEYLSERHDANAMFLDMQPHIDKHLSAVVAQEVPLVSHVLQLAGRVDLIGEWKGDLAIIDFKQSNRPKRHEWITDYYLQISAYAAMVYEMTGVVIRQGAILIAVDSEIPQIFEFDPWRYTRQLHQAVLYYREAA